MMTKLVSAFRSLPATDSAPAPLAPANRVARAASPEPRGGEALQTLSPREREILTLIAHGNSNKLIARALDIAETTVKIHVQHILRKLELSSRVQAAVYAVSHGLTSGAG
jgi:two-component system nitrate/nitrite response regulator NarL